MVAKERHGDPQLTLERGFVSWSMRVEGQSEMDPIGPQTFWRTGTSQQVAQAEHSYLVIEEKPQQNGRRVDPYDSPRSQAQGCHQDATWRSTPSRRASFCIRIPPRLRATEGAQGFPTLQHEA